MLASGILSSLLYVAANVVGAVRWRGYSSRSQTVSELSAIEAPSRPVVIPILTAHSVLVISFGLGVWKCARRNRALRVTGGLLMGLGASDLAAPSYPMHQREALARGVAGGVGGRALARRSGGAVGLRVEPSGASSHARRSRYRKPRIAITINAAVAAPRTARSARSIPLPSGSWPA